MNGNYSKVIVYSEFVKVAVASEGTETIQCSDEKLFTVRISVPELRVEWSCLAWHFKLDILSKTR